MSPSPSIRFLPFVATVSCAVCFAVWGATYHDPATRAVGPGQRVPTVDLLDPTLGANTVILCFVEVAPWPPRAQGHRDSRSQVVLLRSAKKQYGSRDLEVVIVARFDPDPTDTAEALSYRSNFAYDWDIGSLAVLHDDRAAAATSYGVRRFPTTFVIDKHGVVQERWERLVPAYRLAASIETVLERGATSPGVGAVPPRVTVPPSPRQPTD